QGRLVIDIGGGSTEVVLGCGYHILKVESFSIGTVPQNAGFFGDGRITDEAFEAAILSARSHFEDIAPEYDRRLWSHVYGSSGTVRAITDAVARDHIGDGRMTLKSLQALHSKLVEFGRAERIDLAGMK